MLDSSTMGGRGGHKSFMGWAEVRRRNVEAREGKCQQPCGEPCWDSGLRIRTIGRGLWKERRCT